MRRLADKAGSDLVPHTVHGRTVAATFAAMSGWDERGD